MFGWVYEVLHEMQCLFSAFLMQDFQPLSKCNQNRKSTKCLEQFSHSVLKHHCLKSWSHTLAALEEFRTELCRESTSKEVLLALCYQCLLQFFPRAVPARVCRTCCKHYKHRLNVCMQQQNNTKFKHVTLV